MVPTSAVVHIRRAFRIFAVFCLALVPVHEVLAFPADFDGDGKTDPTVWRDSTGQWFVVPSTGWCPPTMCSPYTGSVCAPQSWGGCSLQWGLPGDKPLTGDFDGDGRSDYVVVRPSTMVWYFRWSSYNGNAALQLGLPGDIADEGDLDKSGQSDMIVFRPSAMTAFARVNGGAIETASYSSHGGNSTHVNNNHPATSKFNGYPNEGDRMTLYSDLAVSYYGGAIFGTWIQIARGAACCGAFFTLIGPGWTPVPGNYAGHFLADWNHWQNGSWNSRENIGSTTGAGTYGPTVLTAAWGTGNDLPVSGDFDGDGRIDLAVFSPASSHWWFKPSSNPANCPWYATSYPGGCVKQWGLSGDIPVADSGRW